MKPHCRNRLVCTVVLATLCLTSARGALSLSNPLTGFSGDTTQAGTQSSLATAGLEADLLTSDPSVSFDGSGAHFGLTVAGDSGRNYLRTIASSYATVSFVAEITMATTSNDQAVFIGFGAGGVALFGTPDWSTQASSVSFWPEPVNDTIVRFKTANDVNIFANTAVPGFATGTHRFRMSYDEPTKSVVGAIDLDFAGGAFVADAVTAPIDLTNLFAADGWPTEPSKIFFGGDDGVVFRDLSIVVPSDPTNSVPEIPAHPGLLGIAVAVLVSWRRLVTRSKQ